MDASAHALQSHSFDRYRSLVLKHYILSYHEKHYKYKKNVNFWDFLADIFKCLCPTATQFSLLKYYMFLKCVWYLVYPFLGTPWMLFFYHDARFKLCFYGNYIFCSSGFCCRTSKQKDSNWIMQIAVDYFNIFVKFQFAIH